MNISVSVDCPADSPDWVGTLHGVSVGVWDDTVGLDDDITGGLGPEGRGGGGPEFPGVSVALGETDTEDDYQSDEEEDRHSNEPEDHLHLRTGLLAEQLS